MQVLGWILGIIILIGGGYFLITKNPNKISPILPQQTFMPLTISSPVFAPNGTIPARFTCDGENISPELNFTNIPAGTKSLALIMEDPDVPHSVRADGVWNHWVIWNMPPNTVQLKEGSIPPGMLGTNTSGKMSYVGPCPPDREHRYIFTLYAIDIILSLPNGSNKEELLQALNSHIIEKATLIGRYNRK